MTKSEIYEIVTDETMTEEEKINTLEAEEKDFLLDVIYDLYDPKTGPVLNYHVIGGYENAVESLKDWCMEDGTDEETAEAEAETMIDDVNAKWLVPTAGGASSYSSLYEALTEDGAFMGYVPKTAVEMVLDKIEEITEE